MAKEKSSATVKCLGPTYEEGMPTEQLTWRSKMTDRAQMLKYLETGERYFYAEEGFGSEKRKKKA